MRAVASYAASSREAGELRRVGTDREGQLEGGPALHYFGVARTSALDLVVEMKVVK
jgi:hypothetical protein